MQKILRSALWVSAIFVSVVAGSAAAQQEDTSTVRETHGAWEVRCLADNKCYMQQVFNDDKGQALMLVRLRKLPEPIDRNGKKLVVEAELFVSLGYYLPAGMLMKIDDGEPQRIPYERCLPNGCGSGPLFPDNVVDDLKNGGKTTFTMLQTPKQSVEASFSLSGFTAAYNAL